MSNRLREACLNRSKKAFYVEKMQTSKAESQQSYTDWKKNRALRFKV